MFIPPRTASVLSPVRSKPISEPVLQWSIAKVIQWLSSIGFGNYEQSFTENAITGDILVKLTDSMLKELNVTKVGNRIAILKSIYELKILHCVTLEFGDYVPPSVEVGNKQISVSEAKKKNRWSLFDSQTNTSDPQKLVTLIQTQADQITSLSLDLQSVHSEIDQLRKLVTDVFQKNKDLEHAIRFVQSTTHVSHFPRRPSATLSWTLNNSNASTNNDSRYIKVKLMKQEPNLIHSSHDIDSFEIFSVHKDETSAAFIPLILNRFGLKEEDVQNYSLFVRYNEQDFCLGRDETPFSIQADMEKSGAEPVFILKYIKPSDAITFTSTAPVSSLEPSTLVMSLDRGENVYSVNKRSSSTVFPDQEKLTAQSRFPAFNEASDAVAVYEYASQRNDELPLMIGDELVIKCRQTGWCVVQKKKTQMLGWVPTGCLVEEKFAEDCTEENLSGLALFDYSPIGPNELAIERGNTLKLQKKYQHWFLAKHGKKTGWVPSCYVSVIKKKSNPVINSTSAPSGSTASFTLASSTVSSSSSSSSSTSSKSNASSNVVDLKRKESLLVAKPATPAFKKSPVSNLQDITIDADTTNGSSPSKEFHHGPSTSEVLSLPALTLSSPFTFRKLDITTRTLFDYITQTFSKSAIGPTTQPPLTPNPLLGQSLNLVHLLSMLPSSHPNYHQTCDRLDALLAKIQTEPFANLESLHLQLTDIASVFQSGTPTTVSNSEASLEDCISMLTTLSTPQTPSVNQNSSPSFPSLPRSTSLTSKYTSPSRKSFSSSYNSDTPPTKDGSK